MICCCRKDAFRSICTSRGSDHRGPEEQADAIAARVGEAIAPVAGLGEVEIRVAPFY
ncbi:MAG: hypothetical protein N839_0015525 [Desulfofustis sp. PB-SRB1]|nr:hypothetical protein [Desulfofustis sp. PB-SRB1]MBM1003806.1 hypothetical protein [Desulfofustis sp. PB-SRB1]